MLYDPILAGNFAKAMAAENIFVTSFTFPVVPRGKDRIRVQLSAAHTFEQIDRAVEAFIKVGKELGVIK
jgi:glycine C-acetyltransferase